MLLKLITMTKGEGLAPVLWAYTSLALSENTASLKKKMPLM